MTNQLFTHYLTAMSILHQEKAIINIKIVFGKHMCLPNLITTLCYLFHLVDKG